jgi:hypothetical protein
MASRLTPGFNTTIASPSWNARSREIAQGRYAPYAPLYALLGKLSLADVARSSGIPYVKVSRYLRGLSEPMFYAGVRLAHAIGCSCDELDAYLSRVQRSPLIPVSGDELHRKAREAVAWRENMTQEIEPPRS